MQTRWDIFCRVIDNFGDIGVTWRLARQLAAEYDLDVRLWVDDLSAFARLCPLVDTAAMTQTVQGITIYHWPVADDVALAQTVRMAKVADVVIEAFACDLPAPYLSAMVAATKSPLWLNLEYLSAETWVEGCHGLPSLQNNGLRKFFFFPGFSEATGGLLREADLIAQRDAFQRQPSAQQVFLQRLGVTRTKGSRLVSLFSYENPKIGTWLTTLAQDNAQPTQLLVPEGKILHDLKQWLNVDAFEVGDSAVRGQLTVQVIPFLSQQEYDRLLWLCDFNIVRGEDSFVRAQWSGRPFLWHIYPQSDDTHLLKLEAFLERYCPAQTSSVGEQISALWRAWNEGGDIETPWQELAPQWDDLNRHASAWCQQQNLLQNLTNSLVQFSKKWL